eukprot:6195873-Pleurochrysis_carterae.AAC.1
MRGGAEDVLLAGGQQLRRGQQLGRRANIIFPTVWTDVGAAARSTTARIPYECFAMAHGLS